MEWAASAVIIVRKKVSQSSQAATP